jgi:hypothetical protein
MYQTAASERLPRVPKFPTQFTITPEAGRPRKCRLAWQIGCESAPSSSVEVSQMLRSETWRYDAVLDDFDQRRTLQAFAS